LKGRGTEREKKGEEGEREGEGIDAVYVPGGIGV
jgi:hypothetical protein